MDQEKKEKIATFRFGVIFRMVGLKETERGKKESFIRDITANKWDIPYTGRSYISRSTVLEWLKRYEESGRKIESLYPKGREDSGLSRSIDPETELVLVNLKRELPKASLPVLLKVARGKGIIDKDFKASVQSIYRIFKRHGLDKELKEPEDRRRFEAELPNDLWQSDCMHGPKVIVEGRLRKTFLFGFIDDHSRLIPHAEFYLGENLENYLDCLIKALEKRGLPRKLYLDNAPGFRSHQLKYCTASLGIGLVFTDPYDAAAKGKIERIWKTVRMQLLSIVSEEISLQMLNEMLHDWIDKEYHLRVHGSTKQRPLDRYLEHITLIRPAPKDLLSYFRKQMLRKVGKDRTVSLLGKIYEAPEGLIGNTVTLLYHARDPQRIEVLFEGKSHGFLIPLDVHLNSRIRRKPKKKEWIKPEDFPEGREADNKDLYRDGSLFTSGGEG